MQEPLPSLSFSQQGLEEQGGAGGRPVAGTGGETSGCQISQHGRQGGQPIARAPRYPEAVRGSAEVWCSCTAPCSLPQLGGTVHGPAPEGETRRGLGGGVQARPPVWLERAFACARLQGLKSALLGSGFTQVQEPLALSRRKRGCRLVTKPTCLFVINLKADF